MQIHDAYVNLLEERKKERKRRNRKDKGRKAAAAPAQASSSCSSKSSNAETKAGAKEKKNEKKDRCEVWLLCSGHPRFLSTSLSFSHPKQGSNQPHDPFNLDFSMPQSPSQPSVKLSHHEYTTFSHIRSEHEDSSEDDE